MTVRSIPCATIAKLVILTKAISRRASPHGGFCFSLQRSPAFELARVLVRFDHVASRIVHANHPRSYCTSGETRHKIQGAFARRIRTVSPLEAERCGGLRQ